MSIVNSRIQNLRRASNIDKYENRGSMYGALDFVMVDNERPDGIFTNEQKDAALASVGSTLETAVIDYDGGVSISNSRSVTIADDESTTQMVSFPFTIYSWGFTMIPSNYHNNEIGYQRDWNTKFIKYWNKFLATLDSGVLAKMDAVKSQVHTDPLVYTITADVVAATLAQESRVLGDLGGIMSSNDFFNQMHIVGNWGVESLARQLNKEGLYNATNKQLEFQDKILHWTGRQANAANKTATGFMINAGSMGMLFRLEREALAGTRARTGHEWNTNNIQGIPVGHYYYQSVGDQSASAGAASADNTRAMKEHFGFSVDVHIGASYNSDAANIASPIVKFDIADA